MFRNVFVSEAKKSTKDRNNTAPPTSQLSKKKESKMKAIRVYQFGGPEVLQLEETSLVDVLAPNQVLIRVMYAGVNPVETYIRCGSYYSLNAVQYSHMWSQHKPTGLYIRCGMSWVDLNLGSYPG